VKLRRIGIRRYGVAAEFGVAGLLRSLVLRGCREDTPDRNPALRNYGKNTPDRSPALRGYCEIRHCVAPHSDAEFGVAGLL